MYFLSISCGKYMCSTYLFSVLSLEGVINLCTARHLEARMKLYTGAFYATLTQGIISHHFNSLTLTHSLHSLT